MAKKATNKKGKKGRWNFKILLVIPIVLMVVLLGAMAYHLINPQENYLSTPVDTQALNWESDQIFSTTKSSRKYVANILKEVKRRLPVDVRLNGVKDMIDLYISNHMEEQYKFILKAQKIAKQEQLKVIMIPDFHWSDLQRNSGIHLVRQKQVREFVFFNKISIIFQEGRYDEYTWENDYKEFYDMVKEANQVPFSFNEFKRRRLATKDKDFWYDDLHYPESNILIMGVDNKPAVDMFYLLAELSQGTPFLNHLHIKEFGDAYTATNLSWRTQIILARTIDEMNKRKIDKGYIVLGALHVKTLPIICQSWGIDCKVETLDLSNYSENIQKLLHNF
ncbi:hypothetical protein ACFL2U_01105 [Patescibacteria group bacterium]